MAATCNTLALSPTGLLPVISSGARNLVAIPENNRELRCCPSAGHSHARGNPFFVSWMPDRVRHFRSRAAPALIDPLSAMTQTLNVTMSTLRRASFRRKFRERFTMLAPRHFRLVRPSGDNVPAPSLDRRQPQLNGATAQRAFHLLGDAARATRFPLCLSSRRRRRPDTRQLEPATV